LVYRGETVVPLEPRAVRVLRYLAEHHDRVVPKEELLERVWPDVFTTDGVLKKAVSQVRRALGDDAEHAHFIETYHGRGYRFIAPVRLGSSGQGSAPDATPTPGDSTPQTTLASNVAPALAGQTVITQPTAASDPDYDQLVGREAELAALCAEYRRTVEGNGRPVLITGEAGIGKTQFTRHFERWASEQGALCVYARFFDYGASRLAPYEVFLDFLRTALGLATIDARGRRDSGLLADLRAVAQSRCGVTLPEELFAEAKGSSGPLQMRPGGNFRVVVPVSKCFVRLSRQRPLVMVLDDLQWADEASRDVLGYLMRTARSEPLMLVALVRKGETTDLDQPLAEWLKRQAEYRSYTSLALKPLDEGTCRAAIEAVFGGSGSSPDIPSSDLKVLYRITGGNPYFLTEMLRLLVARGAINFSQTPQPQWQWRGIEDLRLPDTIVLAARAKLDRLPDDVREIVEQASVIGDEFRIETLARMAGRGEEEVERLLCEGVRRGVLSERGLSAGEDCRFYHTTLRRVLYDGLPLRRRKLLHAQAAHAIEVVYAYEADRVAEALSAHYEEAGDLQRTFEWSLRAWQAASSRWHWSEAVTSIERAHRAANELERLGQNELAPANRLKLWLGLGVGYYSVGRLKESETALASAIALAHSLGDQETAAAALLQQSQTRMGLSQYREAIASTEQALEIYRQLNDREGVAQALVQLSNVQVTMGNYEAVAHLAEEVFEGVSTDSHLAAVAFGLLGWARALQGRYTEGVPLLERALEYHDRVGDLRSQAHLLRRLHWVHLSRGQYETAVNLAVRARDYFRSAGDASGEAKLNMAIGQARIAQGLYSEGITFLNRTLESLKVIGDAHGEAESLWLLGRAHGEAGQYTQAAEVLGRALEIVRTIGDRDDEFRILTDIARVRVNDGDDEGGLRAADQAVAIAEELRNRDGLGAALVESARARLRLNQPARALEEIERAVKLLDWTGSGERWRGYWALGLILDAVSGSGASQHGELSLMALRSSVALLDEIREQVDAADVARRTGITRALSAPARDLQAMLLRLGLTAEAKIVASRWLLDGAKAEIAR